MANKTYIDAFDPEGKSGSVCEKCGLCLQQCPVMKMEKAACREQRAITYQAMSGTLLGDPICHATRSDAICVVPILPLTCKLNISMLNVQEDNFLSP
jgi:ferredoxin